MLALRIRLRLDESINIGGSIKIKVLEINKGYVRLVIEADKEFSFTVQNM